MARPYNTFFKSVAGSAPYGNRGRDYILYINLDMNLVLLNHSYIVIFLAGLFGALISDVIKDNCIELPKKFDGKFYLGSFGGLIIGGFAGLAIDGSLLTAFMGGFVGKDIINNLAKSSDFITPVLTGKTEKK